MKSATSVREPGYALPLAAAWLLALMSFSVPGREGPSSLQSLDLIAAVKVGSRLLALSLLGYAAYRGWRSPRRQVVVWAMTPLGLFVGWCILSVLWSPLKTISLGQVMGFVCLFLLSFVVAIRWRGPEDISTLLMHLSIMVLVVSTLIVAVDMVSHEASGLNREEADLLGSPGLVHPNAAGACASMGLVILLCARLLWGWRWTRIMLWPGILVHGTLLMLAISRTALSTALVTIFVLLAFFASRTFVAAILLAVSVGVTLYFAMDPGVELAGKLADRTTQFVRRGESDEQLSSLNSRTEMWEAIWNSYLESPLIGHGFFISSKKGELDVWGVPGNHSAHNLVLQVLVSTGLIGLVMFAWGLMRPALAGARVMRRDPAGRKLASFLVVAWSWYLVCAMLESTFMGPVEPVVVVFFMFGGMLMGYLPAEVPAAAGRPALVPAVQAHR